MKTAALPRTRHHERRCPCCRRTLTQAPGRRDPLKLSNTAGDLFCWSGGILQRRGLRLERSVEIGEASLVGLNEPVSDFARRDEYCVRTAHQHVQGLLQVVEAVRDACDMGMQSDREHARVLLDLALEHRQR